MLGAYTTFVVQELFRACVPRLARRLARRSPSRSPSWSPAPSASLIERGDHPLPLRPAARDPARHLGRQPDPAAGGALDLRRAATARSSTPAWMTGALRARAGPRRSPGTGSSSSSSASVVFALLLLVIRRTRFGLQMRAVTQNRRMAAAMGIRTPLGRRADLRPRLRHRRHRRRGALADRQCQPQSRPGLHRRQLHGRGVRRRRQLVGHAGRRPWRSASSTSCSSRWPARCSARSSCCCRIILFIQKRPRGLFALKGRAVEA